MSKISDNVSEGSYQ